MNQTAPPETVMPPLPAQQQKDIPSTMPVEQVKTFGEDALPGHPGQPAEVVGVTGGKLIL
ncbi:hypothetical protein [Pelagerythrobacter aerophilus]